MVRLSHLYFDPSRFINHSQQNKDTFPRAITIIAERRFLNVADASVLPI